MVCVGGRKRHTYENVVDYLSQYNYQLVSKEYIRHEDKLEMLCDQSHGCNISFKNFKNGRRCHKCSKTKRSVSQRTPFDDVKAFIETNNCILLSDESDYVNRNSNLKLKCPLGHEFVSSIASIKVTNCSCSECTNLRKSKNKRFDGEIVFNSFIIKGLEPNFKPEDYVNAKQKLPYLCLNHKEEGLKYTTFDELQKSKFICKSCYLSNNDKENHWNWQGGISSLTEHLRSKLSIWKLESLSKYKFKCALTNIHSKDLEIHHLYNFSDIVLEVLENTNLPVKNKIYEYEEDDLKLIESTFEIIHMKYGLGIPLRKGIHVLYHRIYGFKNNSPIEFNQFKSDFINGKYNKFFEEVV
jgi:hypothetical protein